jgi:uncharacterized membrane protein YozB (DUF420 family)
MEDLLHRPGFLGTGGNLATDTALVLMIFIGGLFSVGFLLARRGRYEAHRWVQTTGGSISLILVLWLMLLPYRDFVLPGLPGRLDAPFFWLTSLHGLVGLIALPYGTFVILRGHNLVPKALRFRNYKKFMRWAFGLFLATILLGIGVYIVWFVTNPNPPVFG